MKKWLKWIGIITSILILLAVAAIVSLVVLVDPNHFKPLIIQKVEQYTGKKLILNGTIQWHFFPGVGIKLNRIAIQEPANNLAAPPLAEAADLIVGIKLLPLLHKQIELSSIDILNASLNWNNPETKKSIHIEKLNLHAKDVSLIRPFYLITDFNFVNQNPNLSIPVQLKSHVAFNLEHHTLQVTQMTANLTNLTLFGDAAVADLMTNPHITGHLSVAPVDAKKFLQNIHQDIPDLDIMRNVSGNFDFAGTVQETEVQGNLTIDELQIKKVKVSHIIIPVHYQIGILDLSPMSADFYQGKITGDTKINLTGDMPQIALQRKLTQVQIGSLLQDIGGNNQKLKLTGIANADVELTTTGNTAPLILKNLNGTGKIAVNQGILQGVDIGYLLDSAYALAAHKNFTTANTGKTDFGNLTGTVNIRDGVILNNDLTMISPRFKTTGNGLIDLVNQTIDFHLQTIITDTSNSASNNNRFNLYGFPIPIRITGKLQEPAIVLDTAVLTKAIMEQQVNKAKAEAEKQIKDKLHGNTDKLLKNIFGH